MLLKFNFDRSKKKSIDISIHCFDSNDVLNLNDIYIYIKPQ